MADDLNKLFDTSRKAREAGHTRFFNGKPCKKAGHIAERLSSNGICIECHHESGKKSHAKARYGEDREEFLKKVRERRDDWIERNPERLEHYRSKELKGGEWFKQRDKVVARVDYANARARKYGVTGRLEAQEIRDMVEKQCNKCKNCRVELTEKFEIDHRQPMILGGSNDIGNIQILCCTCNRKKGSMNAQDWDRINGRLL